MTRNEPFQAVANAYNSKMWRAVNAIENRERLIAELNEKYIMKYHLEIEKFKQIAAYNKSKSVEFGNAVVINKVFAKFWELLE